MLKRLTLMTLCSATLLACGEKSEDTSAPEPANEPSEQLPEDPVDDCVSLLRSAAPMKPAQPSVGFQWLRARTAPATSLVRVRSMAASALTWPARRRCCFPSTQMNQAWFSSRPDVFPMAGNRLTCWIFRSARTELPAAGAGHGLPRLLQRQRLSLLQQLDGNAIWRFYKGHSSVPWRTKNGHSIFLQPLTELIDVGDGKCQVAKIPATAIWRGLIPVVGELNIAESSLWPVLKKISENLSFGVPSSDFLQAKQLNEEMQCSIEIVDSNHAV